MILAYASLRFIHYVIVSHRTLKRVCVRRPFCEGHQRSPL